MRIELSGIGDTYQTSIGKCLVQDYEVCKWGSGKVFVRYVLKDLIAALAEDLHRNINAGYDNLIVIEGPEGSGKSNLAYQICKAFNPDFDIKEGYIYNTNALKEKLKAGNIEKSTFWMDEGSNIANNRDWQSENNKDLVLFLETMRSKNITFCLCIPTAERLDVYIREHRIRYLVRCGPMKFANTGYKARGYFELRKKNDYNQLKLVGYGCYDPIPAEEKRIYEEIKSQSQDTIIKEMVDPDDAPGKRYKAKYEDASKKIDDIMLALYNSGNSSEGLMQLFGIDNRQVFYNRISKARKRQES